jgi:hypothetical protein
MEVEHVYDGREVYESCSLEGTPSDSRSDQCLRPEDHASIPSKSRGHVHENRIGNGIEPVSTQSLRSAI